MAAAPIASNVAVVLDACVLWPASLRDTLLRLAETPRQYLPRWTNQIWDEVVQNLEARRKLTPEQIQHLRKQVTAHFPEAFVTGYEGLIDRMTNDPKDRHVLAAAVKCGAQVIVTSNLKDFSSGALEKWDVEAQHPDDFLLYQYDLDPAVVVSKLHQQASTIGREIAQLLPTLRKSVPRFAETVARALAIELPAIVP